MAAEVDTLADAELADAAGVVHRFALSSAGCTSAVFKAAAVGEHVEALLTFSELFNAQASRLALMSVLISLGLSMPTHGRSVEASVGAVQCRRDLLGFFFTVSLTGT